MSFDTHALIWLFPIAFMFHDFEEFLLFEPWLRKNADEIRDRIKNRIPAFLAKQIDAVLVKSTIEFVLPISLIFGLTFISSFLAVEYETYGFFLLASGAFFPAWLYAFRSSHYPAKICPCRDKLRADRYSIWLGLVPEANRRADREYPKLTDLLSVCSGVGHPFHTDHA